MDLEMCMEEYLGQCIGREEMMRTGYAQKGYESILRLGV